MRRREFIGLIGGAAVLPVTARAQQAGTLRRIGILMGGAESDREIQARIVAFRQELRSMKWTEGSNLQIDIRYGVGDAARAGAYAAELVSLAPDVILGTNTPTMRALKQTTQSIPIVFAGLADPVGDGIVASLARPGGNITGFSSFDAPIAGKWLQLLKEMSPGLSRVTVIYNPETAPHSLFLPTLEATAPQLGIELLNGPAKTKAEIESAIEILSNDPAGGLVFLPDIFTNFHRLFIFDLAARHRAPAVYALPYNAIDGGLMAYGSDFVELFRRAASYVDRILKGERVGELPVQTPTRYQFVINLKTAKLLGLTIPPALRDFADDLIE
jgi:putative tryptophan/tyrosine transport system substrate-binding protein